MPRIPISWRPWGASDVPTMEFALKARGRTGRIRDFGLVDTGANVTVLALDLLKAVRFDWSGLRPSPAGLEGVGGRIEARRLENVTLALKDEEGALQPVELPEVLVVEHRMVPILGRDVLESFSAQLYIDFHERTGYADLG